MSTEIKEIEGYYFCDHKLTKGETLKITRFIGGKEGSIIQLTINGEYICFTMAQANKLRKLLKAAFNLTKYPQS